MAKQKEAVPNGFTLQGSTTVVNGREYPVEYLQAQSLSAVREYYEAQGQNAEDVILGIFNSTQKQNATQGPKESIRKAMDSGEYTRGSGDDAVKFEGEDAIEAAIEDAQAYTREFVTGAPRQTEGFTKKQAQSMGEKVARAFTSKHGRPPTDEELDAVLEELL